MHQPLSSPLIGLIDPDNLLHDEKLLFEISYEMFPDETCRVFKKNVYLVTHFTYWSKLKKAWRADQNEIPLVALPWIVNRFENDCFKTPAEGGLTDFERSVSQVFNGEMIGINAMAHCCAENMPGFNIWNANRTSYVSGIPPQQWDIPRHILLEQGLLEQLKGLAVLIEASEL